MSKNRIYGSDSLARALKFMYGPGMTDNMVPDESKSEIEEKSEAQAKELFHVQQWPGGFTAMIYSDSSVVLVDPNRLAIMQMSMADIANIYQACATAFQERVGTVEKPESSADPVDEEQVEALKDAPQETVEASAEIEPEPEGKAEPVAPGFSNRPSAQSFAAATITRPNGDASIS